MFNPIMKWVVKVKKSYVDFYFEFDTAEGANDFYNVLRNAYVDDNDNVSVKIYAEYEEDKKEEGENE